MHKFPIIIALMLSLAAGYVGMRIAMPPQPEAAVATAVAERCRAYEILHARLDSFRATEEFVRQGDCAATLTKHLH